MPIYMPIYQIYTNELSGNTAVQKVSLIWQHKLGASNFHCSLRFLWLCRSLCVDPVKLEYLLVETKNRMKIQANIFWFISKKLTTWWNPPPRVLRVRVGIIHHFMMIILTVQSYPAVQGYPFWRYVMFFRNYLMFRLE